MKTISCNDVIFATLLNRGVELAGKCMSGVNSFAEIVRVMQQEAQACSGLATLTVRNATCGWTDSRSVVLRRRTMP
ncbi:MAG: hypothetical protein HUK14_00450 [Muribaculaceae bacterium]|nr:hypothetical protein [Muribaculaceae bacterium]